MEIETLSAVPEKVFFESSGDREKLFKFDVMKILVSVP